jgi:RNA polymerase sigma factor (TIGR02999 family)
MRSVVVDTARERLAQRRGGDLLEVTMNTELVGDLASDDASVLRMSEALDALAAVDNRLGQVVEMRFFGGYSMAEIAETLQITERTVQRDWDKARLLLAASLD